MSEELGTKTKSAEPIETLPHSDWYLSEYVKFANKGLRFPITLYCGGLLISGTLIGGKEYFEMSALQIQQTFNDPEVKDVMAKWVSSWADIYPSTESQESDASEPENDQVPAPGYIHLMNAKVFHPGQPPIPGAKEGMLWRGRLSSIDGFNWGTLAVS